MNPVSHFQASLFNLNECHEKIERLYFQFLNHPDSGETYFLEPSLMDISHYMILEIASFLDEYHIYFAQTKTGKKAASIEAEYVQRIKELHLILKPIIKTIYRWKGIESYRDNFVAHTNRIGFNYNSLIIAAQEPYDSPRQFWEFQLLRDLIHIMFGIISQEFKMELIDAHFAVHTRKSALNPLKDNSKIDDELQYMIEEYQHECMQQGKEYTLNVPHVDFPSLNQMLNKMVEFNHPLLHVNALIRKDFNGVVSKTKEEIKNEMKQRKKGTP
jgi:hypothetical protein